MKKRTKTIINIVVLVALVGITMTVLALNYKELNFTNIKNFLVTGNKWCIAAAFGFLLLSFALEAFSIWYISRRLGHKTKFHSSIAYATADVYYSAITPSATGGQPASAFYMIRDGMAAGTATLTLAINVASYAAAILTLVLFAFIARPGFFVACNGYAQALIIIGVVIQLVFIGLIVLCIVWSTGMLKLGNGCISLLHKMKIIKKPDVWRAKLIDEIEIYRISRQIIKSKPSVFIVAILLNLAQRICHTLITCFVCYAIEPDPSLYVGTAQPNFLDLFVIQIYVLIGHNSIPLPGGVGAFEFMYLNVYGEFFVESFIMSAMMISRFISYYLRMTVAAVYTLVYHSVGLGKRARAARNSDEQTDAQAADGETNTESEKTDYTSGAEPTADGIAAAETQSAECTDTICENEKSELTDSQTQPEIT